MSLPDTQSTTADFHYVGQELDLFARAANWKRYYARILRTYIRGNVLEVGAGIGGTTRLLSSGDEQSWTCLEPDVDLAQRLETAVEADDRLRALKPAVRVETTNDLGASEAFDTILYMDVIEHIEDDAGELARACAHLNPQGHVIVLSPAHQWLFSPFDEAIGHYRRYSLKTLRAVSPAGCELVLLRYLDSAGLLASLANRVALRASRPSAKQIAFWDRVLVPVSRALDPLLTYRVGKSVLGIWRR